MNRLLNLTALALATALCLPAAATAPASAPAPASASAKAVKPVKAPPAPVSMRLDPQVRPQAYTLALRVDPAQAGYSGTVTVSLLLDAARSDIVLHAKDITLGRVQLAQGARLTEAKLQRLDAERVRLRLARPATAGPAQLSLAFNATLQDKDVYGFFRQREAGQWMAATQFEAVGARLAFPVFDEPGWKVPWTLSLTVPQALDAVSNTPLQRTLVADTALPVGSTDALPPAGWKTLQFATTPPLPSYLLAWAVGDLQMLDAGQLGTVPMRIVAPAGRAAEGAYAAGVTGRIVGRLEDYFGMPFPYAKLDSLAIPVTVSFGAMEHPGLVTYASKLLLATPAEQTREFQRDYVVTAAHELAHQWFGNLVTMAWWDDLWLNESFASWMEVRITDEVMPDWRYALQHQQARLQAMQADRLVSARRIQQPVTTDDDLGNLFDTITYQKGHSVLAMFEAWLGEQRFRDGVRRYMQRHAWGTARTDDFLAALGEADASLPEALRSFTQQPGIPLLTATLQCAEGAAPQLLLQQRRLLPLGSPGAGTAQRWQLPVLVRTPGGSSRLLMRDEQATLSLPDSSCPAWVQANDGGHGYYRVAYAGDGLQRLAQLPGLSDAEAMALLDDARGLHQAGAQDSATLLALVQRFAGHHRRELVTLSADVLKGLRPLVLPAQRAAYAQRWQAAFGDQARGLGWLPRPDDNDDDALLRDELLPLVADLGQDSVLRAEAGRLARAWLDDRHAVPVEQRSAVLETAAIDADESLVQALVDATRASTQRNERLDLLRALGRVRTPALAARARALLLDGQIDLRESLWAVLGRQAREPETRGAALDWLRTHQAALVKRMGRDDPASLPTLFSSACGADERQALAATFGPTAKRYQGAQAALQRTLESVDLCSAWRLRQPSGL